MGQHQHIHSEAAQGQDQGGEGHALHGDLVGVVGQVGDVERLGEAEVVHTEVLDLWSGAG